MQNPFEQKQQLYWRNTRRNRRIAEIAKRLARRTIKSVRSVVSNAELIEAIIKASKTGIAILVETPVHTRELAALLPGWAIWSGVQLDSPVQPKPGCGVIATELGAKETSISAGVMIRATGTPWPFPEIDWPWLGDVEEGVLIDFEDNFHPVAGRYAKTRILNYGIQNMTVWSQSNIKTEQCETTGAP
jgi:hypothetical protein